MKKNKIFFENLKITEFHYLEKYIDSMIKLSTKNGDFEVSEDFKSMKRGMEVSKDFIKYRIKEFQKQIDIKDPNDEPWRNAIIILNGMLRTDLTKEKEKLMKRGLKP